MTSSAEQALAVVFEQPEALSVRPIGLKPMTEGDVLIEVACSGVSTGTERLLWTGRMPPFPGLGYPLVPGYESVGRIVDAGPGAAERIGETVFVPGSTGFIDARGLFGATAERVITPAARVAALPDGLGEDGVLLALAATARHAVMDGEATAFPDLIVGHGVLGRLIARITIAEGGAAPTVWETNPQRRSGGQGYDVIDPDTDERRDYRRICDASGAEGLLDALVARLAKGGEIVLAGFYEAPLSFAFPPAFIKEARLRIAAEWRPDDLTATLTAVREGRLALNNLITHRLPASEAETAYRTAFEDPTCLKMVVNWSGNA